MATRIDKLTDEQIAAQPAFIERMCAMFLSTEPADRPRAEDAYARCYRYAGLEVPPVQWVTSLWEAKQLLGDRFSQICWLSLWGFWISRERYLAEVCGLDLGEMTRRGEACADTVRYGGQWWAFENLIVACERPRAIRTDAEGRSHSETRPAIEYRDGTGLYCWHGQLLPADWIARKSVTVNDALRHPNVELRRCAAEIIGWDNVIAELSPEVIDEADPEVGALLRVELPDIGPSQFLRVRCGTGRYFSLAVPDEVTSAVEAQTWIHGGEWEPPEIRT